jgi:hypothetical protein
MRHICVQDIVSVASALHSADYAHQHPVNADAQPGARPVPFETEPGRPVRFVTISRQAGAGGRTFARLLVERLNAVDPGPLPWTAWDNELVERVAREHHLPRHAVAALEDQRPSWLELALGSLAVSDDGDAAHPDELKVHHRVAQTIRGLAELGRVVIVGRGGTFVTAGMPGGVHLRLIAPLDHRISATAQAMGISRDAAAKWVRDKDRSRDAFYRRHWPGRPLTPESFTATYNTAAVSSQRLVESVLPLVRGAAEAPAVAASAKPAVPVTAK